MAHLFVKIAGAVMTANTVNCAFWSIDDGVGSCEINECMNPTPKSCRCCCKKMTAPDDPCLECKREAYQKIAPKRSKPKKKPSKGLGDTVEKTIKKVTRGKLKPCPGCKKRRDALNKLIPYKGSNDGN